VAHGGFDETRNNMVTFRTARVAQFSLQGIRNLDNCQSKWPFKVENKPSPVGMRRTHTRFLEKCDYKVWTEWNKEAGKKTAAQKRKTISDRERYSSKV